MARPILFFLTTALVVVDLAAALLAPHDHAATLTLLWLNAAIGMGISWWMVVLVRGRHGFMGKLVGVEPKGDFRLPRFAKAFVVLGVCAALIGFSMQESSHWGIWLFFAGIALAAAGSTQLRPGTEDLSPPPP